jgi:histone-lysine N-methyltransferase SETD3
LAVAFLEERQKPNSFWKPFFDTFPNRLEESGYFLTAEDLALLEGSSFDEDLTIFRRLIDDEYREIASILPEFGEAFTLEDYAFAKVTVISRSFFDTIDGPHVKFLSPIAG